MQNRHSLPERGPAPGTGEDRVGGNFVATSRAIEPMSTETALLLRKALLLFTLRAAAIHFAVFQIIFEKQSTARTFIGPRLVDNRFTTRDRTLENSFTVAAPVVTF